MRALKALAALLTYPESEFIEALPEVREAIAAEAAIPASEQARLAALIDELAASDIYDARENYVELFDRGSATSLHLFEHVHGNTRDRGPAMVDLNAVYERQGMRIVSSQLPDYLPAVLEFLSTRPQDEVREMLDDCGHILRALGTTLAGDGSRYAAVFGALLAITGQAPLDYSAKPVKSAPPPALDDEWEETPVTFGPGCGQDQPKAQVVRFMNKTV